jgi:hypothetical protein
VVVGVVVFLSGAVQSLSAEVEEEEEEEGGGRRRRRRRRSLQIPMASTAGVCIL